MLIDQYEREDVFAPVPKLAEEIDPELRKLDTLLDDDTLYQQVRADFGKRYRYTRVAWTARETGGSPPAHADPQALVSMELQRMRRAGGRQPGAALVLPGSLP
jgi:hypothetical protein